ncbi:MAG: hypothetical protein ACU0DB_04725 [Paracoccus sp. (in: a-proteobacteria)]|uniref:hypothetical protein n=1 Tax=Paracoccus sp. TaxID=267 RepID=UPI00233C50CB|nr:hypothetical protein [Paracoccus sp. (in: a-proteobacteria)]MDB2490721.1 hypothetical protein [Paracoccus sp. (in: a-proteobacteria)]MDB2552132.1 hypothetical protein [Paracoccus sp. (in: a-proteobacteria)]|tara:strand:- start:1744 stop:1947 length:204 start_codon:yes stop_codon:yes gene_type:complete
MIELLFVTCLSADPQSCRERSLLFIDMGVTACMIHGQQELARWGERHPRETVREWKCRPARLREVKA